MSDDPTNRIEFKLGELTGQVTSMISALAIMASNISSLENRIRVNEEKTLVLKLKMGLIYTSLSFLAGIGGSIVVNYLHK